jgi:hypothetical protein
MQNSLRKCITLLGAALAWFALLSEFALSIANRKAGLAEAIVQFFSYFTILTNLSVAIYWSSLLARKSSRVKRFMERPGVITAIAVYISVVCLVYQTVLRQLAQLSGLRMITDPLLHLVIPVLFVTYWFLYEEKSKLTLSKIPKWLIYPLLYLFYTLLRGHFSGTYPYPFFDLPTLGVLKFALNSLALLSLFVLLSVALVGISKAMSRKRLAAH